MVAQERHIAKVDRLLVVRVHDLVNELLLALILLHALLELSLERIEHLLEEVLSADVADLVLYSYELVVNFDFLASATVNRHLEHFHFNYFLVPLLVEFLRRVHVHAYDKRTLELTLETVDLLAGVSHLHAKVVDIHLVVHSFSADGNDLHRVNALMVRSIDTELRRYIDSLLNLLVACLGRIEENVSRMSSDISLYAMDAGNLLELCLECH